MHRTTHLLILPCVVALWACQEPAPQSSLEPPPPSSTPEMPALEPDPFDDAASAYSYNSTGKRDPFRSLFEELRPTTDDSHLTPLQKFELEQLRVSAILTGGPTAWAMVEDPSGLGHAITRGTKMGRNFGYVSAIFPECLVVTESFRDYTGRKVANEMQLCLPVPAPIGL